jgi:hypothetical protein
MINNSLDWAEIFWMRLGGLKLPFSRIQNSGHFTKSRCAVGVLNHFLTSCFTVSCRIASRLLPSCTLAGVQAIGGIGSRKLMPVASKTKYLEITEAKYISGYRIRLIFNDGMIRVMDFGPFLKKAQNPMITKYRNPKQFKSFHIQDGNLMWGDFEIIFPITDLYKGKI